MDTPSPPVVDPDSDVLSDILEEFSKSVRIVRKMSQLRQLLSDE